MSRNRFFGAARHGLARVLGRRISLGVATAASLSLALQPLFVEVANSQAIVNPSAPIAFRPTIGSSANGTPVVNIATPSFGGVSQNQFQQYNVDTRGIILNNSGLGGVSVIGGALGANPNLVGHAPASVIVNQVVGASPSVLNGPTEVFGQSAQVIVANPNGVSCISCSFINATRVTLSTGVPNPNYQTGDVAFATTTGTVAIEGAGLAAGAAAVDLIGRQVSVQAPLSTSANLSIVAGAGAYDLAAGEMAALPAGTAIPAVSGPAVQSAAAGAIQAGAISVLSADVDLGVALSGQISSLSGPIAIQSAGDVALNGSSSAGDLTVTAAGTATLAGANQALGRLTVSAANVAVPQGASLAADDDIILQASNALTTSGALTAGGAIDLAAMGSLTVSGSLAANGEALLQATDIAVSAATIVGAGVDIVGVNSASLDGSTLASSGSINLIAPEIELGQGTNFQTPAAISIAALDQLTNSADLDYPNLELSVKNTYVATASGALVGDNLALIVNDGIDNAGAITGIDSLALNAATLANQATGTIQGPAVSINLSGDLTNLGAIASTATLGIVAANVLNNGQIETNGTLTVNAVSYRANSAAAVLAGANATLILSGALDNSGQILGQSLLALTAQSAVNRASGAIDVSNGALTIALAGDLDNEGTIGASGAASITAADFLNEASGQLSADGLTLTLSGALANAGLIQSTGDVEATSASLSNSGVIGATGWLNLAVAGSGANSGVLAGETGLAAGFGGALTNSGLIDGAELLSLSSNGLTNTAAGLIEGNLLAIASTGGDIDNAGTINGYSALDIVGGNLWNAGSAASPAYISSAALILDLSGALANGPNGLLQGFDSTSIQAASVNSGFLDNTTIAEGLVNYGDNFNFVLTGSGFVFDTPLIVPGNLSIEIAGDILNTSIIAAGGTLSLASTGGSIVNGAGADTVDPYVPNTPGPPVTAATPQTLPAGLGGAVIYSGGDMAIGAAGDITNASSIIQAGGGLTMIAGGEIDNIRIGPFWQPIGWSCGGTCDWYEFYTDQEEFAPPGVIAALGSAGLSAASVVNLASDMFAGGDLTIDAGTINNEARPLTADISEWKVCCDDTGRRPDADSSYQLPPTPAVMGAGGDIILDGVSQVSNSGTIETISVGTSGGASLTAPQQGAALGTISLPGLNAVIDLSPPSGVSASGVPLPGARPVLGAPDDRSPDWQLSNGASALGDLDVFANQAAAAIGPLPVDPSYIDANSNGSSGAIELIGGAVVNTGTIAAAGDLGVLAGTFVNVDPVLNNQSAMAALTNGGALSGENIAIEADGDIDIVGGSLSAAGDLTLIAGGDVDIAPQLVDQVVETLQSSSGLFSSEDKLTTDTTLTNVGADLSAGDNLDIVAGGDLTLQAADVSGDAIALAAGGAVDLDLAIDEATQSVTGTASNLLTNTIYDHGYSDESAVYNELTAGAGGLTIEAGDGVNVQVASLGPGPDQTLAALQAAGVDPSLSTVTLTDQTWNHDKTTLSAAAAALIALVVAVVTAGVGDVFADAVAGAEAIGDAAMDAAVDAVDAGVAGAATASTAADLVAFGTGLSYTAATALTSGVSAFVSGAISGSIIEGINGDFNLGNVLIGALAAGLSAGLTSFVNAAVLPSFGGANFGAPFNASASLSTNLTNGIADTIFDAPIQAGVSSSLTGSNFGQGLLLDLGHDFANDAFEPIADDAIGNLGANDPTDFPNGGLGKALLFAAVGAAGGALSGGLHGALGGALGAVLAELALNADGSLASPGSGPDSPGAMALLDLSTLLGGFGSLLAGDSSMAGGDAAANEIEDNYLTPHQQQAFYKALAACNGDSQCETNVANTYLLLSNQQDSSLPACNNPPCYLPAGAITYNDAIVHAANSGLFNGLSVAPATLLQDVESGDAANGYIPAPAVVKGFSTTNVATLPPSIQAAVAPYVSDLGQSYGSGVNAGQCAQLVQALLGLGPTPNWTEGAQVEGDSSIQPGTPIATFNFDWNDRPQYGSQSSPGGASGVSHTGIYLGQDDGGLYILNQWAGNTGSLGAVVTYYPWTSTQGHNGLESGSHYFVVNQ